MTPEPGMRKVIYKCDSCGLEQEIQVREPIKAQEGVTEGVFAKDETTEEYLAYITRVAKENHKIVSTPGEGSEQPPCEATSLQLTVPLVVSI